MKLWSDEHLAIEVQGPDGKSETVVPRPYAVIGALARADVRLTGDGVQKREAILLAMEGKIICRRLEAALDSINQELQPDDWLQLGSYRLRARITTGPQGTQEDADDSCLTAGDSKVRIPVLRVRRKGRPSVNRRLFSQLELVGRHADCEVELHCPKASQYHCVLLRDFNRLWCIDLGSGNGTFLNGQRIDCALVGLGGRLKVGDFELEFQRFSRRSASASSLLDNESQSHIERLNLSAASMDDGSALDAGQAPSHVFSAPLPAFSMGEEWQRFEAEREKIALLGEDLRRGLEQMAVENAQLRSDWKDLAASLSQQIKDQRDALGLEVAQQSQQQRTALSAELLCQIEALHKAEAQESAAQGEQQRKAVSQERQQSLAQQRTALRQELSDELLRLLEETRKAESNESVLQGKQQRQAFAQELQQDIAQQKLALRQELSDELLGRLDEMRTAEAGKLTSRSEQQREALSQELQQSLANQRAALRQEISDERRRIEQLRTADAQLFAGQYEQQQQALAQQLQDGLAQQQASLLQELLSRTQTQFDRFASEQQSNGNSLSERLESCLKACERLVTEQSRLSTGLATQAQQIQAIRQELIELKGLDRNGSGIARGSARGLSLPAVIDSSSEAIREEPEESVTTELATMSPPEESAPVVSVSPAAGRARASEEGEDRLLHFVSDRLVQMDSGRQRRLIIYWTLAITLAGTLCVLAWALRGWLPSADS